MTMLPSRPSRRLPILSSLRATARGAAALLAAAGLAAAAMPNPAAAATGLVLEPTGMRFDTCCLSTSIAVADLDGNGAPDLVTGNGFSYALEDMAAYWRLYDRLCMHWQRLYPERFLGLQYESLVAQPEAEVPAPKPAPGPPRRVKRKKKARR